MPYRYFELSAAMPKAGPSNGVDLSQLQTGPVFLHGVAIGRRTVTLPQAA
jgi:hypothetical protein